MKLVSFALNTSHKPRLGAMTQLGILDITSCYQLYNLAHWQDTPATFETGRDYLQATPEVQTRIMESCAWALNQSTGGTLLFHPEKVQVLAPVGRPGKIVCVGQNYRDHCKEQNVPEPTTPILFAKFPTAVQNPGAPIVRPAETRQIDFEAELGVVIGKMGHNISEEEALQYVGGYLNLNDVTARDFQKNDGQWVRGKSCDTFAPMGPYLVTPDEVADPQNLSIQCRVNGQVMQDSNTGQMIFTVAYLISFISKFVTLEVGDVIATGSPHGVGVFRTPPVFLQPGDLVEVEIGNLGTLSNVVKDETC
jgi:acylpyruvate hydrolase